MHGDIHEDAWDKQQGKQIGRLKWESLRSQVFSNEEGQDLRYMLLDRAYASFR